MFKKRLFRHIKINYFKVFILFLIAIILSLSLSLIPYFIGKSIDEIENNLSTNNFLNLDRYLIILSILVAVLVLSQFFFDFLIGNLGESLSFNIREKLFNKYNRISISDLDKYNKGELLSRIINDVDNLNTALLSFFKQLVCGIMQVLVTISVMFYLNWILALIIVILTPFGFLLSYVIAKKSSKLYKKNNDLLGDISSYFLESIMNIETIESFNYESESYNKFLDLNNKLYVNGQKAQFISSFVNPSTRLINNIIICVISVIGSILFVYSSEYINDLTLIPMSAGLISSFIQYSFQYAKPFDAISSCISEAQNGLSSLNRINEILDIKEDIDTNKEINFNNTSIEFNNVNFSYVKNKKVIKDFNLMIKEGHRIALVGPTGCGKTTIINLLLRFYEVDSGEINLGNIDTKNINKKTLRSNFGMVLQDSYIFSGTIYENIAYSKTDATKEEVIEATKKAHCYDLILRMKNGFNTFVSENSGLSDGEKQLISIARIMLIKPKVLLLDEATSNIDTRTEKKIVDAINELSFNKTSVIVAHRLSTIKNSDYIVVIKDGKIIESGNHVELMNLKGFYFNLYSSQFND